MFHAATNLKDMPFSKITEETFHEGFDAKAIGGLNLHKIVKERAIDLDYFVAFTSVSGILGTPGQSTYAAANVFLDSLVAHRRREGSMRIQFVLALFRALVWSLETQICRTN